MENNPSLKRRKPAYKNTFAGTENEEKGENGRKFRTKISVQNHVKQYDVKHNDRPLFLDP